MVNWTQVLIWSSSWSLTKPNVKWDCTWRHTWESIPSWQREKPRLTLQNSLTVQELAIHWMWEKREKLTSSSPPLHAHAYTSFSSKCVALRIIDLLASKKPQSVAVCQTVHIYHFFQIIMHHSLSYTKWPLHLDLCLLVDAAEKHHREQWFSELLATFPFVVKPRKLSTTSTVCPECPVGKELNTKAK